MSALKVKGNLNRSRAQNHDILIVDIMMYKRIAKWPATFFGII